MTRFIHIAHRLTGWNAVKNRAIQLGLDLTDAEIKEATAQIKKLADIKKQTLDDVDSILMHFHRKSEKKVEEEANEKQNGNK